MAGKRPYGTGRIYVRTDSAGRESFYGSWWADGQRVNRRLGLKRPRGSREGLTWTKEPANAGKMQVVGPVGLCMGLHPAPRRLSALLRAFVADGGWPRFWALRLRNGPLWSAKCS